MSKELIERLRADAESTDDIGLCADAAERIEELERENNELAARIGKELNEENLALRAEIAELVAALKPFGAIDLVESRLPAEFAMLILRARAALAKVRKP